MVGRFRLVPGRPICDYAACVLARRRVDDVREVPHRKSTIIDGNESPTIRAKLGIPDGAATGTTTDVPAGAGGTVIGR